MEEFFRFIQQSERERNRLEARASYDSVFAPAAPISEQSNKAPAIGDIVAFDLLLEA